MTNTPAAPVERQGFVRRTPSGESPPATPGSQGVEVVTGRVDGDSADSGREGARAGAPDGASAESAPPVGGGYSSDAAEVIADLGCLTPGVEEAASFDELFASPASSDFSGEDVVIVRQVDGHLVTRGGGSSVGRGAGEEPAARTEAAAASAQVVRDGETSEWDESAEDAPAARTRFRSKRPAGGKLPAKTKRSARGKCQVKSKRPASEKEPVVSVGVESPAAHDLPSKEASEREESNEDGALAARGGARGKRPSEIPERVEEPTPREEVGAASACEPSGGEGGESDESSDDDAPTARTGAKGKRPAKSTRPRGSKTKQTARISTGGRAPKKQVAEKASAAERRAMRMSQKKYAVDRITDREHRPGLGDWYCTRYMDGRIVWNPKDALLDDGLEKMIKIVDQRVDDMKRQVPFDRNWNSLHVAQKFMLNFAEGDCVFQAIRGAMLVLGYPDIATSENYREFLEKQGIPDGDGLGIRKAAAYARFLGKFSPHPLIHMNKLRKNLLSGSNGIDSIFERQLGDGIYLVDCVTTGRVGHCMAIRVMHDDDPDFRPHYVWEKHVWVGMIEVQELVGQINGVYEFAPYIPVPPAQENTAIVDAGAEEEGKKAEDSDKGDDVGDNSPPVRPSKRRCLRRSRRGGASKK